MGNIGTLGENYFIKKIISQDGSFSIVYLVEDKKTKKQYAAKVEISDEYKKFIIKESELLLYLKEKLNCPYIIDYICEDEGDLVEKGKELINKNYLILEYCPKGTLLDYVLLVEKGFSEKFAKLIFKNILNTVEKIHKSQVAHLDLKLENILLDNKYNIKIADFGVSLKQSKEYNINQLKYFTGSDLYNSPQVVNHKKYNGYKNDIFSLGIILFCLVTGKLPFLDKNKIEIDNINGFLEKYEAQNKFVFSPEFKKLFSTMVSKLQKDRPSIEEIYKNFEWFNEIKISDEKLIDLENELKKEFENREKDIKKVKLQEGEIDIQEYYNLNKTRFFEDKQKNYFNVDDKILTIENEEYLDNYIKIKGNFASNKFMNLLCNMINKKYTIKPIEGFFEFVAELKDEEEENEENQLNLEEEGENEEDEEEENNDNEIIQINSTKNISIKIGLYENKEKEYILNFFKLSGDWKEFYNNFKYITSIVKELK